MRRASFRGQSGPTSIPSSSIQTEASNHDCRDQRRAWGSSCNRRDEVSSELRGLRTSRRQDDCKSSYNLHGDRKEKFGGRSSGCGQSRLCGYHDAIAIGQYHESDAEFRRDIRRQ